MPFNILETLLFSRSEYKRYGKVLLFPPLTKEPITNLQHLAHPLYPWFLVSGLHCPKSNPNFRNITWNVEENMILHEIFRVVLYHVFLATFHVLLRKIDYFYSLAVRVSHKTLSWVLIMNTTTRKCFANNMNDNTRNMLKMCQRSNFVPKGKITNQNKANLG